jgi:hypothetical protein
MDAVLASALAPEAAAWRRRRARLSSWLTQTARRGCTIAADLAELAGDRDGAAGLLTTAGGRTRQAALNTAEQLLRQALKLGRTADQPQSLRSCWSRCWQRKVGLTTPSVSLLSGSHTRATSTYETQLLLLRSHHWRTVKLAADLLNHVASARRR